MHLLSIENLSLAAEVTAVLLLLSFAWPERKSTADSVPRDTVSTDWEPAKNLYLQACLYRGLYLQQFKVSASSQDPFEYRASEDDPSKPSIPEPWQDRLTKCLNRNGFDSVLNSWLSIEASHREESCLSMVTLHQYAELVTAQGAMVTEQALKSIAKQLTVDAGRNAIISRYLPDRFLILQLATNLPACHKTMQSTQQCIADPTFFTVAGQPFSLSCLVSVVALNGDSIGVSKVDELDEGCVEAENSGRNIVSKVDGHWTDSILSDEPTNGNSDEIIASERPRKQIVVEQTTSQDLDTVRKESLPNSTDSVEQEEIPDENDPSSPDSVESSASDISAVANPDDIAALFAQINTNKSTKTSGNENVPASTTQSEATVPVATIDSSAAASPEEIAAMLNSVNKEESTSPVSVSRADSIEDLDQAASADDIASLFASVKPDAVPSAFESKPAAVQTSQPNVVLPKTEEELSQCATADDIASLFASVKPTNATSTTPTTTSAPPALDQIVPSKKSDTTNAVDDLNEVATADDIAALFATADSAIQPKTAEVSVPPKEMTGSNAPVMSAEDLAASASLDDIEALFASMKK